MIDHSVRTQGLTIPESSLLCALVFVTERPMQCDFFSLLPSGRRNLPIIVLSIIYSLGIGAPFPISEPE